MNLNCEFFKAYVECSLWSSTDNSDPERGGDPLDKNYCLEDIEPATLAKMRADCEAFQAGNAADLELVQRLCDTAKAGHNFWLNRNEHGAGFWDEYFGEDKVVLGAFKRLDEASKVYGSFDLYVGDDGMIYGN